jgi:hypothetical protein
MRKFAIVGLLFIGSIVSAAATTLPTSLGDPICQQATSLAACQAHVIYVGSLHPYVDTSPLYMKQIDPRDNGVFNYAGGSNAGVGAK